MRDPTAKLVAGKEWIHWILYNIDGTSIEENNTIYDLGFNSYGKREYAGMCPPDKNPKEHTYIFELYALKDKIKTSNPTLENIEKEIKNLIIDKITYTGKIAFTNVNARE